ncbi:unnamed protein product [Enterobius vermicularis]|uniref:ShKT domain-containing protein n=1 Tax=Enterobius vermicularis TaxID=51028 RepID=A0A0N4VQ45_ENTVE|nr:unnamed protein product [Enterobius vermicularis]
MPMKLPQQTIFEQTCKCKTDWKNAFCKDLASFMEKQTICRQFLDSSSNCNQFITRCFKRSSKNCSCCFNQPEEHCKQLPCSNGKPVFEASSNTSCVCYGPSSYPYQICPTVNYSHALLKASSSALIPGLKITPKKACIILFSLIGSSILLTSIWITVRYVRLKKEHTQRSVRLQTVQAALLKRRADEDRYLP